jgi:ubiquinone/menaquinone biosynthesis C-methylase UbiE
MNTALASSREQLEWIEEAFDGIASVYDSMFTSSSVGRAQRAQVTTELNRLFIPGSRVLELNCGTGEDALALGNRGVEVCAFDASTAMIEAAKRKLSIQRPSGRVSFEVLPNEQLCRLEGSFDGAFSNFAGLNCSRNWPVISHELGRLVKPGGHMLLCIMGRACLWELIYFLLVGEFRKAFRRRNHRQLARVGARIFDVFYRSVREAEQAFAADFRLRDWRGIGVFVPPSYCEALMSRRPRLLNVLAAMDARLNSLTGVRCWGDHILLDMVRSAE